MPLPEPKFYYRKPAELALQVVEQLGQLSSGLSPDAQAEVRRLLTDFRLLLVQAAGPGVPINESTTSADYQGSLQRDAALRRFLAACESSAVVPDDIKDTLGSAHLQPSRGGGSDIPKDKAREIVAAIDQITPPPARKGDGEPGAASTETVVDPVGLSNAFAKWFLHNWKVISIEVEDAATPTLIRLGQGLRRAQNDADRIAAAQVFLSEIKAFAPAYEQIINTSRTSGPADAIEVNTQKILATLRKVPVVGPALAAPAQVLESFAPSSTELAPPPPTDTELAAKSIKPPATPVSLHTSVDFPAEVSVFDSKIPLVVQFTIEQHAESRVHDVLTLDFLPEEVKEVLVVCNAEGFKEETGVTTRLIEVYQARDSQPAVFLLTPEEGVEAGRKRISLDFIYLGAIALTSTFEVELKSRPPVKRDQLVTIKPLIEGQGRDKTFQVMGAVVFEKPLVDTPDLVLRIAMSADERELTFTLDSPKKTFGYRQTYAGRIGLPERRSPREFLESTYLSLNDMAGTSIEDRKPAQTAANKEALDVIGWNLYDQLFPQALKDEWRRIRTVRAGKNTLSLLIVSDEPWIPWEMMHTYTKNENGDFVPEGFLCEQFRLSRWVAGRRLPEVMALNSALLIAPKSNLESVKKEKAYFTQLGKMQPTVTVNAKALEQATEVKDAFTNQKARLYHFACHGDFESGNPDDSRLLLFDSSLRPIDIIGPTQVGIEKSRPLIFLNACTSAGADVSLTGIGGWSKRFVDAGVTAFIGSLWEVNDTLAAEFAKAFYDQVIVDKAPLGQAFQEARRIIKEKDPGNPTWLAYVLYAHPNGKVEIGT